MWKIKMGDVHHTPKAKVAATIVVANANSNANSTNPLMKKPKDRVPVKISLTEINQYLMCQLCSGYLIDATAIIECQHTFCKSCILKYLETNSYCPICDVQLNKAKPHLSLRADTILQKLVYKTVPGLFVSEIRRRKDFARKFPSDSPAGTLVELDEAEDLCVLSPDDAVSLSLEYFKSDEDSSEQKQPQQQSQQQQKQQSLQSQKKSTCSDKANDRRYLQCPAAVSVGLLKKFIRMKYGLLDDYRVDLLYNGDRDSNLENDLTLLDLAFIFKWNKDEPMCFHYRIFDRPVKSVSPRPGTKRPAPSMMDEPPPDDDAASGPPNRSSMASASPSKLPRISDSGTNSNNTNNTSTNSNSNNSSSATHSCSSPSASSMVSPETGKEPSGSSSSTTVPAATSEATPSKKSSKGHNSLKSSHKKGKGHHNTEEIPCSTMSRRSMSANANTSTNTSTNTSSSPITRGRVNSSSKKEQQQEDTKSKSSANSNNSKLHKQPSVTTKLNNGSVKLSISTGNLTVSPPRNPSPPRERLKISLGSIAKEKSSHNHHSHEKRHHHHHHRRHKVKKDKNREKKDKKEKNREKDKSKHSGKIKLSLNLNNLTASSTSSTSSLNSHHNSSSNSSNSSSNNQNQSQNQSQQFCSLKDKQQSSNDKEVKGKQQNNGSSNIGSGGNGGNRVSTQSVNANVNTSNGSQSNSNSNQSQNQGGKTKVMTNSGHSNKNSGLDIQPGSNSSSSARTSGNNHHPLLPDSVQVPKSVTLIPVNPNAPNSSKIINNPPRANDKNSNRLNSHTFTHPITNKSLHQITVTEVPPPQQKPNVPTNTTTNNSSNSGSNNGPSNSGGNSTTGGSSSLEKAIVNATTGSNANKPQFSGPGSMEITKIYSSTSGSKVFDSATAKKLKERKGLDISISGTSVSVVKPSTNSREENYRQNISSGGMGQQSNSVANTNKAKSAAAALLSGKMPPGITIGPANAMAPNTTRQSDPSKGGLTFTIPQHMGSTTVPGNLPALRNIGTKLSEKNGKKDSSNNSNSGNVKPVRTPPPTVPLQQPQIQQQQQPGRKGENLSTVYDMRTSPSPPKEKNSSTKEQTSSTTGGNNSKGFKRSFDAGSLNRKSHMSIASASAQNQRDSPGPERKRDRSNSNSGSRSSSSSATDHDSPLDLSGKSSRSEHSSSNKSDISFPKGGNRPPTPVPKSVSPLQPSNPSGKSSSKETSSYHQTNKNSNNSSGSKPLNQIPNAAQQSQTILSIAQSRHQKQQQQQQQQSQFLQHQLGLGLGGQQQQNNLKSNPSSSARTSPHIANSLGNQSNSMNSNNSGSNSSISGSTLDSLSSQLIPMSSTSPPNTTGFNSLRMLADATLLHKMHPMNSLMAVAGMCSQGVPPLSLSSAGASVGNSLSPGMFGQSGTGAMNPGKSMGPPHSLLDPSHHNIFAALQNQSLNNGRVGVGGMVGNPFGSSLSPPLYYSGTSVRPPPQLQPPPTVPSLRIPSVTPKLSSGGKSPSTLNSPISMTPPHLYPSLSPTSNSSSKAKSSSPSPPTGANPSSSIMSSVLNSKPPSRPTSNNSISSSFNQNQIGHQRSQKVNGIHSSVPIIPPGVHNPLLPTRISSSSPSGHNYLSAALASAASKASALNTLNSNKSIPQSNSPNPTQSSAKSGIPASMKISNFLPPPNKTMNSSYNANAQATITSSSSISSSLARFLNSLPPLLTSSQQQHSPHSMSLLPPFSVPSTKVENTVTNSPVTSKVLTSESNSNSKSVGKLHSSMKIGLGASSDSRKDTKGKDETVGISSSTSSLVDKSKMNSGVTPASNTSGFGTPFNLNMGLGSPPSSSRTLQAQSQAVRHIPNPCLLFNRQNSGGNNNNVNINVNPPSSVTPTMTLNSFIPPINNDSQHDSTNSTTTDGKKSPLVRVPISPTILLPPQTIPLQAQVAPLSMLSLFPGVSVPLKVEVPVEEKEGKVTSSPLPSPVGPPVKKTKVEISSVSVPSIPPIPSVKVSMPIIVPSVPLQSSVKQSLSVLESSLEKKIKEKTSIVSPSQTENKKEEKSVEIPDKITTNCNEVKRNENCIGINNKKMENDEANHKADEQSSLSTSVGDKKEDLEWKSKENEEATLANEDNTTVDVDSDDVDIVDVVSVDIGEENERMGKIVRESEETDKGTTDVSVNILDSETSITGEAVVKSHELVDMKESTENSPNKIVSKIEEEREVKECIDEEVEIPAILTGTDLKEVVTGDKLEEPSEPKLEMNVDIVEEVKTDVINEMEKKCEEAESASESAMEIDEEGDDGEIELDVGIDEPMEVPLQGILQSLKSDENSQSVLANDNEMNSEEAITVSSDFIQSNSQVTNNIRGSPIISSGNQEESLEESPVIPSELESSVVESSPEKKMKFSEEIDMGETTVEENENIASEIHMENEKDNEDEMEVDVDVCDEETDMKINSEDHTTAVPEELPIEEMVVEKVSPVVSDLPCEIKTEETDCIVRSEVVVPAQTESVSFDTPMEEVEETPCEAETEDSSPEKIDNDIQIDVELDDSEESVLETVGSTVDQYTPELALDESNSSFDREIIEQHENNQSVIEDFMNKSEEPEMEINESENVDENAYEHIVEELQEEKIDLNSPFTVLDCNADEIVPQSNSPEENLEMDCKSDSQNIIEMSERTLEGETPTVFPSTADISPFPAPITIAGVSLPTERSEAAVAIKVEVEPEPVAPIQSPTSEEVQLQLTFLQQPENTVGESEPLCDPQIESKTHTDTPVTISIPFEQGVMNDQVQNSNSETEKVTMRTLSVSSPNSEGERSSLSSPSSVVGIVGVGVQRVNLKKMENLEKVAAGLLATANMNMGSININNNNNSLAPSSCDITISAANQC